MLKKKKSLSNILAGFNKTVSELKTLAEINSQEIECVDSEVKDLTRRRQDLHEERGQALNVAGKIEAMLA